MKIFDSHTHVQFAAYDKDRADVVRRALDDGIFMINVGTQKNTSKKAVDLVKNYEYGVYATVGLHPIHLESSYHDSQELGSGPGDSPDGFMSREEREFDREYYKTLASDPKVVAIGECGFDYYRISGDETKMRQERSLISQIELAIELDKPLMVHCRSSDKDNAYDDFIRVVRPFLGKLKPSVMHFFAGSWEDAEKFIELGFYFTFGGVITFVNNYDDIIKNISIEKIMTETDAPYVTPAPYRGQRNEPAYVREVVKKLSELKDLTFEETAKITFNNTKRVFSI